MTTPRPIRISTTRRVVAMVAAAAVAVTTLVACVPFAPGGESAPELRLYDGPIPAPAPLDLDASPYGGPQPPEPPADLSDTEAFEAYERAVEEWIEAMQSYDPSQGDGSSLSEQLAALTEATKRSDEASVAAWQSLLVASGVAVGYGPLAVSLGETEGLGIPMTTGELRMHALLGAAPGYMSLPQLADLIEGYGIFREGDLTEALHEDITRGSTMFHTILSMLNPGAFLAVNQFGLNEPLAAEEVLLSGAQVGLILRKLSAEVMVHAEQAGVLDEVPIIPLAEGVTRSLLGGAGHGPGLPFAVPTQSLPLPAAAGDGPCGTDETPFRAELRKNGAKVYNEFVFSTLSEMLLKGAVGDFVKASIAGLNLANALAKFFMLESDFTMNGSPLVRTKNRTPGEHKDVTVRMSWMKTAGEEARKCLSAILAPYGISIEDRSGDAGGIDVNFSLKGDRLWLDTSKGASVDNYLQKTSSDGVAVFPIVGKPQNERLPEGAEPEEVTSRIEVAANVEGSDLVKDLISLGWDAISPDLTGFMINILSRMKLIEFYWDAPVRDWTLEGEFEVTLTGEIYSHYAVNKTGRSYPECGGSWSTNRSTTSWGTVSTYEPHRVQANYLAASAEGQRITGILFRTKGVGLNEIVFDRHNGGELAHLQVELSLNQNTSEPGEEPMPTLHTDPGISGCGGGGEGEMPQEDCGPRNFLGIVTINSLDNAVHITSRDKPLGGAWTNCGTLWPQNPAFAPNLANCPGVQLSGGKVPSADAVFGQRGSFQISGSTQCYRHQDGTLSQNTFNWTLDFCRIKDGERAC